jgi:hypothetical protein
LAAAIDVPHHTDEAPAQPGQASRAPENWRFLTHYAGQWSWRALRVDGQALVGGQRGLGHDSSGAIDDTAMGWWYGGRLSAGYRATDRVQVGGRLEYARDPDLVLRLPNESGAWPITTVVGTTATVRVELMDGLQLGAEYEVRCGRGDVEHVLVQRNVDAFPRVWRMLDWFVGQKALLLLTAQL